ncbi:MAG: alpha/beta fold hydrolase [Proteobacteria bacterium]|nr:alpha/beta fold hydrolase [Pseudomonadota bacterium]
MPSERVEFTGSQGDALAARLDRPLAAPRAYALFAHCFTCSKDIFAASRIARALAAYGVAVLRFDFTGLGSSQGEFANTNFSSNVEDLVRAADYLRQHERAPAILIGHSLGGAAVLAAASRVPEAVAVATIGAPADPAHVSRLLAAQKAEIESEGEAEVVLGGRTFRIRKQFLDDLAGHKLDAAIGAMNKALLVLHSPIDETVAIDDAARIFTAAKHPKSFVSLDSADHLLTRHADAEYVAEVLAGWVGRYLPAAEAEAPPAADQGEVVVSETGESRFAQAIVAGPHRLAADEPASVGGADTGPTPYGLLLAALGACTTMTLRLYAERKKLPLEKVSVRLRHEKIHARDCENCETQEGKIDRIEREIVLEGPLDGAQRQRLLEIAEKCPVHRTLHSEVLIESRLTDQL